MKTSVEEISRKELLSQARLLLEAREQWLKLKTEDHKLLSGIAIGDANPMSFTHAVGNLMNHTTEQRRFFFAILETILKARIPKFTVNDSDGESDEKEEKVKDTIIEGRVYQKDALEAIREHYF